MGVLFVPAPTSRNSPGLDQVKYGQPDFLDRLLDQVFMPLHNFPKPVIAALNGITLAGGSSWPCAPTWLSPRRMQNWRRTRQLWRLSWGGGASVLPRIVPLNVAKHLLLTGKPCPLKRCVVTDLSMKWWLPMSWTAARALAEHIGNSPLAMSRMLTVANGR